MTALCSCTKVSTTEIAVITREEGSGTRGAFIELFGIEEKSADGSKVDNTTETADITQSTGVMLTSIADNEYAIGYVSLGSLNETVKAVKIDGVEPNVSNVKNDTYKVRWYMYTGDTSENESRVPLLGRIPLLGNLFKHKTKSKEKTELSFKREKLINELQKLILNYLLKLSKASLDEESRETVDNLFNTVNYIERIGDHAVNIDQQVITESFSSK